jgi:hypothetical protein
LSICQSAWAIRDAVGCALAINVGAACAKAADRENDRAALFLR